jgi:predicted ATPase
MARLDRLGPAKEVAQIGAAIGREFSHAPLAAVARNSEEELNSSLDRLVAAGLLFRQGAPPNASYLFKHALVRDVAYGTLLRNQRRALHYRIAQTLEQQFRDIVELEPETLAQHYAAGGLVEQAVPYWLKAGSRAALKSANQEAIRHLQKGIEHLSTFAESFDRLRQELAFQTLLGPALLATKGWAAPEPLATYVRARELSERLGDSAQLFKCLWGTWLMRWARGEVSVAKGLIGEMLKLADRDGSETFRLQANHAGWTTCTYCGDLKSALHHAEQGVAIYRREEHGTLAIGYGGHDPGVCARAHASQPLWLIGYPDKAVRSSQESLALAQELSHGPSMTHALFHDTWLHQFRRDERAANDQAEALIASATNQGQAMYVAIGKVFLGWALAVAGRMENGIGLMRQGVHEYRATGAESWAPYYEALLAEQLARAGLVDEASTALQEAQHAAKRAADQFFWDAELRRLEGELHVCLKQTRNAEESFCSAIAIAREQHARSLELRACISLARVWREQGKCIEARTLLGPIYGWFTEGFDTFDLKEAETLLNALAA